VQSVERAISILRSFSLETPERGVTELSRELGLHKSTISRLMITLERGGLLARDPETERYRLGVDLIGMAAHVASHMDVREVARPVLRQLAEACEETVNLSVLDQGQVVNLEQSVPPVRQVKNLGAVGRRTAAHCTAAGKVLLAHLSAPELGRILDAGLEPLTPHTITDPQALRDALVQVLRQGYAVAQEELEEGLNVVAAPIYDHAGRAAAALSIAGPAYRVSPARFPPLADQVKAAAAAISRRLGHQSG
jgi:IclR family KDG regulon transcriptional repressor